MTKGLDVAQGRAIACHLQGIPTLHSQHQKENQELLSVILPPILPN